MRKFNLRIRKSLAVLVAAVQVFAAVMPVAAAESIPQNTAGETEGTIHYVALGDSITAGDSTYVNIVGSFLKNKYGTCEVTNLGVDGIQSSDLKEALVNRSHPAHAVFCAEIKDADIITLDIGSNDILVTAYGVMADCFGCSTEELGSVIAAWSQRLSSNNWFEVIRAYWQVLPIAYSIHNELYNGKKMKQAVIDFESNYVEILKTLKNLAPNAQIYVGNLYNPYHNVPSFYIGSFEIFNMETLAKQYVQQFNTIISKRSAGCCVVDLYNTMNSNQYIVGDPENYDFNPHPNAAGHKAIANKFIAAMQ